MKNLLFTVSFFWLIIADAQTPIDVNYDWGLSYGNGNSMAVNDIERDQSGNFISVGTYSAMLDFDPGSVTANFTSGAGFNGFIQKLDSNGNFLWAKIMDGVQGSARVRSVVTDDSNNVYITGSWFYNGQLDLDPGPNTDWTSGNRDFYVVKLDSSGNYIWGLSIGGAMFDVAYQIEYTGNRLYITGEFESTVDFDPGPGVFNLTANDEDAFILKLDLDGNFVDAVLIESLAANSKPFLRNLKVDYDHNLIMADWFFGTVDFDPSPNTAILSNQQTSSYILKLDTNLSFIWVKSFDGGIVRIEDFAFDKANHLYFTGTYRDTVDFDPGPNIQSRSVLVPPPLQTNLEDAFIAKLTSSGNYVWAHSFGNISGDQFTTVSADKNDDIYFSGGFQDTLDFDPGPGIANEISSSGWDSFILKLDSSSQYLWSRIISCTDNADGRKLYTDTLSDFIHLQGRYRGDIDLDLGANSALFSVSPNFARHTYFAKYSQCIPAAGTDVQQVCDSLTWIDGLTYYANTDSAVFTLENASATGCDSIVTLDLTILSSSASIDVIQACDSLVWLDGITYYSDNNTATYVMPNASGCDSLITLDLTVTIIDTSITQVDQLTLSANATSAVYQWLDCDNFAPIAGQTNKDFTAATNGNYAVQLTVNGCTDTSSCFAITSVGIGESASLSKINVFPNPTQGLVNIISENSAGFSIKLYNALGQIILEQSDINTSEFQFIIEGKVGVYTLEIQSEGMVKQYQIIKK